MFLGLQTWQIYFVIKNRRRKKSCSATFFMLEKNPYMEPFIFIKCRAPCGDFFLTWKTWLNDFFYGAIENFLPKIEANSRNHALLGGHNDGFGEHFWHVFNCLCKINTKSITLPIFYDNKFAKKLYKKLSVF